MAGRLALVMAALPAACASPELRPLPPDSFAFGVFGDGPYRAWESGRFRRVIEDVNGADVQWLVHVGDILWYPCSDAAFADRREALNSITSPVIYTPGDNEWADCHERVAGGFEPLERLASLRAMFYAAPGLSLGGRRQALESQSLDPDFAEFVENARWTFGGFVFATIHMVGTGNGAGAFPGRTPEHDAEVARRTGAAIAWLEAAFRLAESGSMSGIVLALHANPDLERREAPRAGYEGFVDRLEDLTAGFPGPVLLIHGDTHEHRVDQPLRSRETGEPLPNFTRLETYGSPEIGWVRVVVDSVAGRIVAYEPRLMPPWILW